MIFLWFDSYMSTFHNIGKPGCSISKSKPLAVSQGGHSTYDRGDAGILNEIRKTGNLPVRRTMPTSPTATSGISSSNGPFSSASRWSKPSR